MKYIFYTLLSFIALLQSTYAAYESVYKKVFYKELEHQDICNEYIIKWLKYYDLAYKLAPMNTLYSGSLDDADNDTPTERVYNTQQNDITRDGFNYLNTLTENDICMILKGKSVNILRGELLSRTDETRFKEVVRRLGEREYKLYNLERELTIIGKTIGEGGNNNVSTIEAPIPNMPEWDEIEALTMMDEVYVEEGGSAINGDCSHADDPGKLYTPPLCKNDALEKYQYFYDNDDDNRNVGCYKDPAEIPFFSERQGNDYVIPHEYWLKQYNPTCPNEGSKACPPFTSGQLNEFVLCTGCLLNNLVGVGKYFSGCIDNNDSFPISPKANLINLSTRTHIALCMPKTMPPNPLLNSVVDVSCEMEIADSMKKIKRHALLVKYESFVSYLEKEFVTIKNNTYSTKLADELNDIQVRALKEIGCSEVVYRNKNDRTGGIVDRINGCFTNRILRDEHVKIAIERIKEGEAEQDRAFRADNRYQLLSGSMRAFYDYTWTLRIIWECHKKNKCHFK